MLAEGESVFSAIQVCGGNIDPPSDVQYLSYTHMQADVKRPEIHLSKNSLFLIK